MPKILDYKTIQSFAKDEFELMVKEHLNCGYKLQDDGYEVIKEKEGNLYSQLMLLEEQQNLKVTNFKNGNVKVIAEYHGDVIHDYAINEAKISSFYENGKKKYYGRSPMMLDYFETGYDPRTGTFWDADGFAYEGIPVYASRGITSIGDNEYLKNKKIIFLEERGDHGLTAWKHTMYKKPEYGHITECGFSTSFYINGHKMEQCSLNQDGYVNGLYSSWYKNGDLKLRGKFKDGYKIGRHVYFWRGGKLKCDIFYNDNGKIVGKITNWYKNGQKEAECPAEFGGGAKIWYPNGKLKAEGYDFSGLALSWIDYIDVESRDKMGKWTFYNKDGSIKKKKDYGNLHHPNRDDWFY